MIRALAAWSFVAACSTDHRVASEAQIVVMAATTAAPPGSGAASDLVVMDLDGSHAVQVTHDSQLEFLPHFAPDGTQLLYTEFEVGTYGSTDAITDIATYDFATERETLLTDRGDAARAAWSPDGSTIAFFTPGDSLAQLLSAPALDEAKILAEADKVMAFEHDLEKAHLSLLIKLRNSLTPAQQAKLRAARDK